MNTRELIRLVYSALEWNEDGSIDDAKAIALLDLELPAIEPSESARELAINLGRIYSLATSPDLRERIGLDEGLRKMAVLIEADRARVRNECAKRAIAWEANQQGVYPDDMEEPDPDWEECASCLRAAILGNKPS